MKPKIIAVGTYFFLRFYFIFIYVRERQREHSRGQGVGPGKEGRVGIQADSGAEEQRRV